MRDRDFVLRQGDTASPLETVLTDDDADPVDLAGATVELALAPAGGGELVVDYEPAAIIGDPADGRVRYGDPWLEAETDTPGLFLGEFRVTFADDRVQTYPNDGYIVVAITPNAGALTAGELLALVPTLSAGDAQVAADLARRVVVAHVAPNVLPDPLPAGVELIVLRHALRIARATPDTSGQVVSESLGSYTYRLARPLALDDAFELGDDLVRALEPWAARQKVYDLDTTPSHSSWPADWWQRNLDNPDE